LFQTKITQWNKLHNNFVDAVVAKNQSSYIGQLELGKFDRKSRSVWWTHIFSFHPISSISLIFLADFGTHIVFQLSCVPSQRATCFWHMLLSEQLGRLQCVILNHLPY